jgi:hypothetical protein
MRHCFFTSPNPSGRSILGFNLTEMALVLAIMGLVLGGSWVAARHFQITGNIRRSTQQILLITQNMRGIFAEQGGITGVNSSATNQVFDQLKIFPIGMRTNPATANGNILNAWAGVVRVAADDCTGTENSTNPQPCFGVTYQNVPQDSCTQLLMGAAQSGVGLVQVTISNVNGNTTLTAPVGVVAARGACSAVVSTIQWVYLLRQG